MTRTKPSSAWPCVLLLSASAAVAQPTAVPITPAPGTPNGPTTPAGGVVITGPTGAPTVPSPALGAGVPAPNQPTGQSFVQPVDPQNPLAGIYRFRGSDALGAYSGTIEFVPLGGGNYSYLRRLDPDPSGRRRSRGDKGLAQLTGTHLYTKEVVQSGLGSLAHTLSPGLPHRVRHGFYRLSRDATKGRGFSFRSHVDRGNEQLRRLGSDAANNHVQLLVNGSEAFPMMRAELAAAKHSIYVQTFIYMDDQTGRWFGELLAQKAREGLDVRLLTDDYGTFIRGDLMHTLQASGVKVILQHDRQTGIRNTLKDIGRSIITLGGLIGSKRKKPKRGVFNHDHRKIITVDGRVGFIGGMNIMNLYEFDWHDIHARVEGRVVRDMEALFISAWKAAGGEGEAAAPDPRVFDPEWWPGDMDVELVDSMPGVHRNLKKRYLGEIAVSRRRILIENAYFLEDDIITTLKLKAQQGVETVVIIPSDEHNDVKLVVDAFKFVQNDIVRSGVQLYKYQPRMTHGKVASFDGVVGTVGSCNLDDLALEKLYEANLWVKDRRFCQSLEDRVFRVDLPQSKRVEVEKQGWWDKLKHRAIHFFRGFL